MRASAKGFTLLEVMIALSIVALSLTAVTATISQMVGDAETMRNRTYASWIAQNRIAELRLAAEPPEVGSTNGEVEFANVDWTWRAIVEETGVDDLFRVDVSVALAGSDDDIRTVTGFVGLGGAPGEANRVWADAPVSPDGRGGSADTPGIPRGTPDDPEPTEPTS